MTKRGAQSGGVVVPPGGVASCWCRCKSAPGFAADLPALSPASTRPWNGVAAPRLRARAIYRDPVRSEPVSDGRGQRPALDLPDLAGSHVPWAGRHWALPVLNWCWRLRHSYYFRTAGTEFTLHKKLTDWARQMVINMRLLSCPGTDSMLVLVGDNSYAVLDLLHCCQSLREPVTDSGSPDCVGRRPVCASGTPSYLARTVKQWLPLRDGQAAAAVARKFNKAFFRSQTDVYLGQRRGEPGTTASPAPWNSPPRRRSGTAPASPPSSLRGADPRPAPGHPSRHSGPLLCTDPEADPTQILEWLVLRWQLEVTFHEVRTHLGMFGGDTTPAAVRSRHRWHHARPTGTLLQEHGPPFDRPRSCKVNGAP